MAGRVVEEFGKLNVVIAEAAEDAIRKELGWMQVQAKNRAPVRGQTEHLFKGGRSANLLKNSLEARRSFIPLEPGYKRKPGEPILQFHRATHIEEFRFGAFGSLTAHGRAELRRSVEAFNLHQREMGAIGRVLSGAEAAEARQYSEEKFALNSAIHMVDVGKATTRPAMQTIKQSTVTSRPMEASPAGRPVMFQGTEVETTKLPDLSTRQATHAGVGEGGFHVAVHGRAMVFQLGGRLKREITTDYGETSLTRATGYLVSPTPYASAQEYGTVHNKAHPYLRPTLTEAERKLEALFAEVIGRSLKEG